MIDLDARYTHPDFRGVALYVSRRVIDHEPVEWATGDDGVCYGISGCDREVFGDPMCYCPVSETEVYVVMVGDDREHLVEVEDLTPIAEDDYCGGCGQIGCTAEKG